jgi:DNA invertase Pin-like site-specific DNA recombinase
MDEGISGKLGLNKRPGLDAALKSLKRDDVLLCVCRDRIARSVDLLIQIGKIIKKKKASIFTCDGTGDLEMNAHNWLAVIMRDVVSEFERLNCGERTHRALMDKKSKGLVYGEIPYGWRKASDGMHLEKDEREQEIIEEILRMHESGIPIRKICPILNERGIKTKKGGTWAKTNLGYIMKRVRGEEENRRIN